jgi:hypothetical protein
MVGLLSDFASDHEEMDKLSRKLGLAILTLGAVKDTLSKPEELKKTLFKRLKHT